jgi:hypothetical protein
MANEVSLRVGLSVRKGHLQYASAPAAFSADMAGAKGPTPGAVTVTTAGDDIDLSGLTTPGWVFLFNTSASYAVEWGVHDGSVFHPVGWLLPGCGYPIMFSPNLGEEHVASGTGTTGTVNTFHMKSYGGPAVVKAEAFES